MNGWCGEVADLGIHGELVEVHHACHLKCLPRSIPDGMVWINPDGGRSQVQIFCADLDSLVNDDVWHPNLLQYLGYFGASIDHDEVFIVVQDPCHPLVHPDEPESCIQAQSLLGFVNI